ncbi:MAG TPA: hypothetical protein VFA26_04795 [Gemmataceae bacterium]|nr:hypothetical protein [Gemmataceae bacterium]
MRKPHLLLLLLAASLLAAVWAVGTSSRAPRSETPPGCPALAGEVRDADGPVAGARVRVKGEGDSVLADAVGRFQLPWPADGGDQPRRSPGRVTAWKEGYFIGGAAVGRLPLRVSLTPLPADDNEHYAWVDPAPDPRRPQNCGNCHAEIYREWAASGHARAATGKHFLNLYDGSDWDGEPGAGWSLAGEHPFGKGVCSACHAPTMPFDAQTYFDIRNAKGVAAQGVHCDYCHKVRGVSAGTIGLTHGRFNLELLRPREGQIFFGPLDDVDRGEDACSPLYHDSRYCASCHEGVVFGVPVYTTYGEWQESQARREGKHCQTCHMAPTGRMANLAPGKGGIRRDPRTLGNHFFFRGGKEEMLRECLKVSASVHRERGELRADVEVRAEGAGHRVPTGYIDRHLLLVVEGLDGQGRPAAARSGPRLPPAAGKSLAGSRGRLYGRLLTDFDGISPAPFWRSDGTVQDTRLTVGKPDRSAYVFRTGVEAVRVRLIYRRFWQQVAEVKKWPDNETVVFEQVFRARR